jgi:replication factor A1
MLIGDWTSNKYVTVFSDEAEKLLGKTAQEVGELLDQNKEEGDSIFSEITFQQKVFKLRTKIETYQDVPKAKTTVAAITDVNFKEYNKHLLSNIQRLTGISQAHNA